MQMLINPNLFVVQWSKIDGCYHTNTIEEMLRENNNAHMQNRTCDYLPVAFAETYREGQEIVTKLEARRPEQHQY